MQIFALPHGRRYVCWTREAPGHTQLSGLLLNQLLHGSGAQTQLSRNLPD